MLALCCAIGMCIDQLTGCAVPSRCVKNCIFVIFAPMKRFLPIPLVNMDASPVKKNKVMRVR